MSAAAPLPQRSTLTTTLLLVGLLPLFLQSFHYIVDVPPLYVLSKAWPLLTLPLALLGIAQGLPYTVPLVALVVYVVAVPPLMTILYFGQDYLSAVTSVVKILPFTYYFSLGWLLHRLCPRPQELERAFVILGFANLVLLGVLWVTVPTSAYRSGAIGEEVSKLFVWEAERGYRITLPLVFGIFFIFHQARAAFRRGPLLRLALPLAGVALMLVAFKQRTVIAGIVILLLFVVITEAKPWPRVLLLFGGLVLVGLAMPLLLAGEMPWQSATLGGSMLARQLTTNLALDFLAENPLRWIFGAGALTRASDTSFQQWFNHPNFYLVDIGWLGIVFEYGIVGSGMILAFYLGALLLGRYISARPGALLAPALCDYLRYLLLTSPLLSAIWAPGEVSSLLAVFVYLHRIETMEWRHGG